MSPFEALPTEILQQIMHNLTPFAYLNVKFVCRRLYLAGKNVDGGDLVVYEFNTAPHPVSHINAHTNSFQYNRMMKTYKSTHREEQAAFGAVMSHTEASLSTSIKREQLTCSACGKIAGIALHKGFSDESFQRADGFRQCLACQSHAQVLTSFHIRGKAFHRCRGCGLAKPESLAVREQSVKEAHYAGSDKELAVVLKKFRSVSAGEEKICAACYGSVADEIQRRGLENEERKEKKKKTSFGTFKVRCLRSNAKRRSG